MSVENILVMHCIPTTNEAKELILSNLNTANCEFELIEKWISVRSNYIKFTVLFEGEIRSSEKIHSVSISDFTGCKDKHFFTGKINF